MKILNLTAVELKIIRAALKEYRGDATKSELTPVFIDLIKKVG